MKPFAARLLFHPGTMTSGITTLNLITGGKKCMLLVETQLGLSFGPNFIFKLPKKIHLKQKNTYEQSTPPTHTLGKIKIKLMLL